MPKGIFSLKNHLWAEPKCGVTNPERTIYLFIFVSSYKWLRAALRLQSRALYFRSPLPPLARVSSNSRCTVPPPACVFMGGLLSVSGWVPHLSRGEQRREEDQMFTAKQRAGLEPDSNGGLGHSGFSFST